MEFRVDDSPNRAAVARPRTGDPRTVVVGAGIIIAVTKALPLKEIGPALTISLSEFRDQAGLFGQASAELEASDGAFARGLPDIG
jgi:hypothetical protein